MLQIVASHTTGDPQSSEKWLNCRLRDIQDCLAAEGHVVSLPVIRRLLHAAGYRWRSNRQQLTGPPHPDRDRQFRLIAAQRTAHLDDGQPVISVDTKKKELIGDFKNAGRTWGTAPAAVNVHDFPTDARGRAVPYGIYDRTRNVGWVGVGESGDTPSFAVDCLERWCAGELRRCYPHATRLLIEADGGGSNSARSRVWKVQLQEQIADRYGVEVTVCHYPPGTAKWNPIEHRLFSEISKTWAGCPLRTWEGMLSYLRDTRTATGLRVAAVRIRTHYPTGVKVADAELAQLNLHKHDVCPIWNYTIYPHRATLQALAA
ncbi:MAG: ISAzo13 family transposase [Chloroflexota bacterium]|nr:ISAzo13 family transposase [Chloroflexota bacterium]